MFVDTKLKAKKVKKISTELNAPYFEIQQDQDLPIAIASIG